MSENDTNQNQTTNLHLRQISFFILLVLIAYLLFINLSAFLTSFLGAVTFYVLLRKWDSNLVNKRKWKKGKAALLLLLFAIIVIVVPVYLFGNLIGGRIVSIVNRSNDVMGTINKFADNIQTKYKVEILSKENINAAGAAVANALPKVLTSTFNTLSVLLMMYFILYFMLSQSKEMEATLMKSIPLRDENTIRLGSEMHSLIINNALGVPLIAILQGIVGLIGYLIIGVPDPWFWFGITAFGAMLPVVGAAVGYVPLAIVLFAQNQTWQGVAVLAYGLLIIGVTDNVARFALQKKLGDVHPLITVLGVIMGINLFGFIGIIFGPILISLFILLVEVYNNEFSTKQNKR